MLYLFSFLVTGIMNLSDFPEAKSIKFGNKGLDLFPLGEKLADKLIPDLQDIDTSDVWGQIEYNNVAEGMLDRKNCFCKKVIPGRYQIQGLESYSNDVYVGYTKENEIQHVLIKLTDYDFNKVKDTLQSIYGHPQCEITGGMNGLEHKSYSWVHSGIDIYFSGLGGDITFAFPKPKEYFDQLIKGGSW